MRIFFDSEFTNFTTPHLISLGLISEDGREFYREMADSWLLEDCSLFVVSWVLPLLDHGKVEKCLYAHLGKHLDLLKYLTDVDNQFPRDKRRELAMNMEEDEDLSKHFQFLSRYPIKSDIKVAWNPFLESRLQGMSCQDLFSCSKADRSLQVVAALNDWFNGFGEEVILVADSEYDEHLLADFFLDNRQEWPCQVSFEQFEWSSIIRPGMDLSQSRESYYRSKFLRHHALDDARVLRLLWQTLQEQSEN